MGARIPAYSLGVMLLLTAVACGGGHGAEALEPRPGHVNDMEAFERFIETRPTPEEFREVYPDVVLVLPGDIATQEMRTDNSRFFAELDGEGQIRGGEFR